MSVKFTAGLIRSDDRMPRRRVKNKKRLRSLAYNNGGDQIDIPSSSLEEDLRQQRIRQKEKEKQEEQSINIDETDSTGSIATANDGDGDDVGFERTSQSIDASNCKLMLGALPFSSIVLSYDIPSNPISSKWKRNYLRTCWPVQHQFENMSINPKAAALYCKKKWAMKHTLPDSVTQCAWDLSCKHRLHSSARTFDVALLDDDDVRTTDTHPTIVTIFQDGWGLFHHTLHPHHRINTLQSPAVHSIRMHEGSKLCGTISRSTASSKYHYNNPSYLFRWYKLPHATNYLEADIPHPVTDFCFGTELAIFSCSRYRNKLNPLFLPLVEAGQYNDTYISSAVRTINVQNFPQSDALRVEMMCDGQEKIVAFGHRNGQVSILDLRVSGTVCSILEYEEKSTRNSMQVLGCVSDLGFLSGYQSGHQIIVKRSFGSTQLHDLRKSSSSLVPISATAGTSSSNNNNKSTTVIRHMTVPSDEINLALTTNCNGFAINANYDNTDEITTMLSPYINSDSDACLGVWSLKTGHMVGSRVLQQNANCDDTLYVELCQRTTPSFSSNKWDGKCNTKMKNVNNNKMSLASSSSFGVWLKCGAFTKGKMKSKVGSMHHISFPGD